MFEFLALVFSFRNIRKLNSPNLGPYIFLNRILCFLARDGSLTMYLYPIIIYPKFPINSNLTQGCQVGDFIARFYKTGEIWTPFG